MSGFVALWASERWWSRMLLDAESFISFVNGKIVHERVVRISVRARNRVEHSISICVTTTTFV